MLKKLIVIWMFLSAAPVYAGNPNYPVNPLLFDGALYLAGGGLARFDIDRMEERKS